MLGKRSEFRWKRYCTILALVLSMGSGWGPLAAADSAAADRFTEGALQVEIDGIPFQFDPAPFILPPGRTMVPVRALFESLGAVVEWHEATQKVTGTRGDITIEMTIGSQTAWVNGGQIQLDVAPQIRHGRMFIPLRFVSESLHSTVYYDPARRKIAVWSRPYPLSALQLENGMNIRFRIMVANLFLVDRWDMTIDEATSFPGPISYTIRGRLEGQMLPPVRRSLVMLGTSRRFLPTAKAVDEDETAPWLSAGVFEDLRVNGKAEGFVVGGPAVEGQTALPLTATGQAAMVFTLNGRRVQVPVVTAAAGNGDRLWILNSASNPLVLKFQPVGLPLRGVFGTVGYQVERIVLED